MTNLQEINDRLNNLELFIAGRPAKAPLIKRVSLLQLKLNNLSPLLVSSDIYNFLISQCLKDLTELELIIGINHFNIKDLH